VSDTSVAGLALRLVGSLAVVVGLLFLIARFANKRFTSGSGAAVQVVARQSLTKGSGVAVLTVGTRVLVVGTTDQQVSLLAELEPDELLVGRPSDAIAPFEQDPGLENCSNSAIARNARPPGPLAGSLLSPTTWKQTLAAFTGTPPPAEDREAS
jgi:flagellar protein FliO/FliZ